MSRMSREDWFRAQARLVAERGTCNRLQVGAILEKDNRVISQGYNGVPAGLPHCDHALNDETPCLNAVHAEANALVIAARYGISTESTRMWITHMPCINCAKLIINAGVKAAFYEKAYRDESGIELLHRARIWVNNSLTFNSSWGEWRTTT